MIESTDPCPSCKGKVALISKRERQALIGLSRDAPVVAHVRKALGLS